MQRQSLGLFLLLLILMVMIQSCLTIPELKINYRMPYDVEEFEGHVFAIDFLDNRDDKDIFGPGARDEFKGFPGNFSFFVSRGEEDGFKIGLYDLKNLFLEAFKRKFINHGILVDEPDKVKDKQVLIVLKVFNLDLKGRKWMGEITYETRLLVDGIVRSTQTISGTAERMKLFRNDQAHILMGELFSDIVNKLDIARLLRQAELF